MDAKAGQKVGLTCKVGENGDEELLLCTLREGASESQSLDLIFDHYTEFKVHGNASVHLTGYYIPDYDEGVCFPYHLLQQHPIQVPSLQSTIYSGKYLDDVLPGLLSRGNI